MSKAREFWITPHIVGDATGGKQHWAFPVKTEWMGDNMIHVREVLPVSEDVEEMAKKYIEDKQWAFYGRKLEYDRALEMYSAGHASRDSLVDHLRAHRDELDDANIRLNEEISRLRDALGKARDEMKSFHDLATELCESELDRNQIERARLGLKPGHYVISGNFRLNRAWNAFAHGELEFKQLITAITKALEGGNG